MKIIKEFGRAHAETVAETDISDITYHIATERYRIHLYRSGTYIELTQTEMEQIKTSVPIPPFRKAQIIKTLTEWRKTTLFGDGMELEYINDGFPQNVKGLNQMTDFELLKEYEECDLEESDE